MKITEEFKRLGITQEMLDQAALERERDTIYGLYLKFQELQKLCKTDGTTIYLCLSTEDEGGVIYGMGRQWWLDWSSAEKGIEEMEKAIAEIKAELAEEYEDTEGIEATRQIEEMKTAIAEREQEQI